MYTLSKKASSKTIEFFNKSEGYDNTDAFRHGYWNALMAKNHGADLAKQYADAHEARPESTGLDLEMDLSNNQTGRDYGITYSDLTEDALALRILDCVLSGRFQRIVDQKLVLTNYEEVLPQYGINTTDLADNKIRIDSVNFNVIGQFRIPGTINGKDVTEIGNDAFRNQVLADSFNIPGSVVRIGNYAFAGCINTTTVYHDNYATLTHLGTGAFMNSNLSLYRIPDNLQSISDWTFAECGGIAIIYDGTSLTTIGNYAFYNTELNFNSKIPNSITTIGAYAFYGGDFWSDFALSPNNTITYIGNYAFANNPTLKSIVLTESVISVGANAFFGCTSLTIFTDYNERPYDWSVDWNSSNRPVAWNCEISSDKSYVLSMVKSNSYLSNPNAINGISTPFRKDYTLDGWYENHSFTGTKYTDIASAPSGRIYAKWTEPACVAEGTLITLADGTQKAVEDLTGDEQLLVWNLFTGTFDTAPILFIDHDPSRQFEVVNLTFSDGTVVKVIDEHGFWDFDLNRYVFLRHDAAQYLGHWFQQQIFDENGDLTYRKVQLVGVTTQTEYTSAWSPVTYGHLSYYVNGMLSMPGATTGLINIFDVDSQTLKIDEAAYFADVTEYGLFTYEEFSARFPIPEFIFDAFGGRYLKVAMGKGLLSEEMLINLMERYSEFFSA